MKRTTPKFSKEAKNDDNSIEDVVEEMEQENDNYDDNENEYDNEEDVKYTKEGYIDDEFIADDDEIEDENDDMSDVTEEDEETKRKRREEKKRRKEEKRMKKEKKEKQRKLKNVEDDDELNFDEEGEGNNEEMDEEMEGYQDEYDENFRRELMMQLEPEDKKRWIAEEEATKILQTDCPERILKKKSVLNRLGKELDDYLNGRAMEEEQIDENAAEDEEKMKEINEKKEREEERWNIELENEVDWIYVKMMDLNDLFNWNDMKKCIEIVLRLIYQEHHEIMYIYTYDKYQFYKYISDNQSQIKQNEILKFLWNVWDFDTDYYEFMQEKEQIVAKIENMIEINDDIKREYKLKIDECYSITEMHDLFDEFSLKWNNEFFDPLKDVSKGKKFFKDVVDSELDMFYNAIGLTIDQFVENIKVGYQLTIPQTSFENPNEIAAKLISQKFPNVNAIIGTIRARFATEFAYHHKTRKILLFKLKEFATISTEPTTLGEEKIDAFHKYAIIKRLKNKYISKFDRSDDILFLLSAVDEKYITMKVNIGQDFEQFILTKLIGETDSNEWKHFKQEIISMSMKYYLRKYLEREIIVELRKKAVEKVISEMQENLDKRINCKRHYKIQTKTDNDLKVKFIGGITFSKAHMLLVKVNALNGETENQLLIDVRRNDQSGLRKTIDDFFGEDTILVGIEANTRRSLRIKQICNSQEHSQHLTVEFVNKDLGRIFKIESDPDIESQLLFSAASLCRQLINPIAEFTHIITSKERLMGVNLQRYQQLLTSEERALAFAKIEQTLMTIVNKRGVNYSDATTLPHYQNQLHYVCGLGPSRAQWLIDKVNEMENGSRGTFVRHLSEEENLNVISKNCQGFLIVPISESVDITMLDETRILLENYNLAQTLVNSAVEEVRVGRPPKQQKTFKDKVLQIRESEGKLFDDLNIEEFIEKYQEENETNEFRQRIKDIQNEILKPFGVELNEHYEMSREDLFEGMTNKSFTDFKKYQLIEFTVTHNDNGRCFGNIGVDLNVQVDGLDQFVERGATVVGRIREIKYDDCKLIVDCRQRFIAESKIISDQYYNLTRNEPTLEVTERERRSYDFVESDERGRNYSEVKMRGFKMISASRAKEELKNGKNGDYILVPIPEDGIFKGSLMLVWKWTNDVFLNLECEERGSGNGSLIDITIKRFNITFSTGSEFEYYIHKINLLLDDLRNHRKFNADDDRVDTDLKKLKSMHSNMLNYFVSVSKTRIGMIRISCIPGTKTVNNIFVKVDRKGFEWNGNIYSSTEELVTAFKNEMMNALNKY